MARRDFSKRNFTALNSETEVGEGADIVLDGGILGDDVGASESDHHSLIAGGFNELAKTQRGRGRATGNVRDRYGSRGSDEDAAIMRSAFTELPDVDERGCHDVIHIDHTRVRTRCGLRGRGASVIERASSVKITRQTIPAAGRSGRHTGAAACADESRILRPSERFLGRR